MQTSAHKTQPLQLSPWWTSQNRHGSSGSNSSCSSKSSSSRSRSISKVRHAQLFIKARNLPGPHKFVYRKSSNNKSKKKILPTDISTNGFLTYSLRTAGRLAKTLDGKYAKSWNEYIDYLNYLGTMRIDFSYTALLTFGGEYRRSAKSEGFNLTDSQQKNLISAKHFHFDTRRTAVIINATSQLFRGSSGLQKAGHQKRYRYPCCHKWQENRCPNPAAECFSCILVDSVKKPQGE